MNGNLPMHNKEDGVSWWTLSGPVEEEDGEVFKSHSPITIDVSWRI
jgi:hypothetical protein